MAKIENTTVYPTVTPAMDDLLIATDVSDNNKTVTFLVSSLSGGTGVLQGLQSVLDTGNVATQTIDLTGDINLLGGPGVGFLETCQIKLGGGYGAVGEVITSQGAGSCATWSPAAAAACCSWNDSLFIGATATITSTVDGVKMHFINAGGGINISTPASFTNTGISFLSGQVQVNGTEVTFDATGQINDSLGTIGTAGQWLTSQGPGLGVEWSSSIPAASCCDLQATLAVLQPATTVDQSITASGTGTWTLGANNDITSAGTNLWSGMNRFDGVGTGASDAGIKITGTIYDGATVGAAGEVLTSTGAAVQWAAAAAGSQNLQQVLDIGNNATGVNANISITGFIKPGTIQDTSGSVGGVGEILSSTGTGLAWISNDCCNLADTLLAGATSPTSITMTGTANISSPFMQPASIIDAGTLTGTPGEVLTSIAGGLFEWQAPIAAAVSSVSLAAAPYIASSGVPLNIPFSTGAVSIEMMEYAGTSNVGHVPDGGSVGTYLEGDGSWSTPGGTGTVTNFTVSPGVGISASVTTSTTTPALTISNSGVIDLAISATPYAVSTGNGLTVANVSGGTSTITPYVYNLGNTGLVPPGGIAGQYLNGEGVWVTAAGAGVSDVSLSATIINSVGVPLSITPSTGNVVVSMFQYAGGSNIGHVPEAGTAGTYLEGDGSWSTPVGAVIDVNPDPVLGTSTGVPLRVSPTTGNVLIESLAYSGDTRVGHVPSGGGDDTTLYLNGAAGWSVPVAIPAYSDQFIRIDFGTEGLNYYKQDWMTYGPALGINTSSGSHQVTNSNVGYYDPITDEFANINQDSLHMPGCTISNPGIGACGPTNRMELCGAETTVMANVTASGVGPITDVITVGLFKTKLCPLGAYEYFPALTCDLVLQDPETMICCTSDTIDPLYNYLDAGESYFFGWKCESEDYVDLDIQGTMWVRVRHVIAP